MLPVGSGFRWVRAPMAVPVIRSAMYWGTTDQESSVAAGKTQLSEVQQQATRARRRTWCLIVVAVIQCGSLDSGPFQPTGWWARLLEVKAHHHSELLVDEPLGFGDRGPRDSGGA